MTNLQIAQAKLNELIRHLDKFGETDLDRVRNLAWEAKKALEKIK